MNKQNVWAIHVWGGNSSIRTILGHVATLFHTPAATGQQHGYCISTGWCTSSLGHSRPWLLGWHIWWQLVRSKWTNFVASKFSRPHPTRLFSLGFCEEWCVFTATHAHWRSQRKDLHSFAKSYTSDVTSHIGCNIFTIWTVSSTRWWSSWGLT